MSGAFPASWRAILSNKVAFYRLLEAPEQARFEEGVHDFLASVSINGTGTVVDDTDRLLVAFQCRYTALRVPRLALSEAERSHLV